MNMIPAPPGLRAVYAEESPHGVFRLELPIVGFSHSGDPEDLALTAYVLDPRRGAIEAEEVRTWGPTDPTIVVLVGYVDVRGASLDTWESAVAFIGKVRAIVNRHDDGAALKAELQREHLADKDGMLWWRP